MIKRTSVFGGQMLMLLTKKIKQLQHVFYVNN